MITIFVFILLLLLSGVLLGDSATQTDWSGGGGIPGPVLEWTDLFSNETDIMWNNNVGYLELHKEFDQHMISNDFNSYSAYSEDIDGDGDMDVLAALFQSDDVVWFENSNGSGTSWTEHLVAEDHMYVISVYPEDIDSDGDFDILGATLHDDEIFWWENIDGSGISWTEHIITGTYGGACCVHSVDLDGDGDVDVLSAANDADDITWWENIDGTGANWIEHTVDGNFDGATTVYSDDMDDDGDMDILCSAMESDEIVLWENIDGSGSSWSDHVIDEDYDGACAVRSFDVDVDGDRDILGTAYESGEVTWWENLDGSATSWLEHTVNDDFNGARSVSAGDIDEDGDMDVIGASLLDGEISIWENLDGSATSWAEYTVSQSVCGNSVYFADIDGDSAVEIIGTKAIDGIWWWEVSGYSLSGNLESTILELQVEPSWGYFQWNSETPSGTSISFQLRSSDNYEEMGDWSDSLTAPCSLQGILDDGDKYVQYRVLLGTDSNLLTPTLNEITISWNLVGISETDAPIAQEYELYPVTPNPSAGSTRVRFGISEPGYVHIAIFDLSGRKVSMVAMDEFSSGYHEIYLKDLSSGIYFCRMTAGEFSATQRFAVIR